MQLTRKLCASLACSATLLRLCIPSFGDQSAASVDQITGNVSAIYQSGTANTARLEQQAILGGYANISSIQQTGDHDSATVSQSGSHDSVSILQHGDHDTATVSQNGSNPTAQVTQWGNYGSVGITQSGGSSTSATKQH